MRRGWLPALVAGTVTLLVLGLLGILAAGFGHDPNSAAGGDPLVGKRAPYFALQTLSGKRLSLRQFRGHPLVVNFWASWCQSCSQEHRYLVSAHQRYASRGVRFLSVSFRDPPSDARAFLRKHGGAWPDVSDLDGATAVDYGVTGVPETFLIDRRGVVRFHSPGPITPAGPTTPGILDRQINKLMGAS